MKTFQVVVLFAFGFLAVLGLIFFATSKGGGGGAGSVGPVVVWGLLPQEAMDIALGELANANKRYGEVSYVEKSATSFGQELAQAIAEGAGPDLLIISQEQLLSERAKLSVIPFTSIPKRTYVDNYVPMADVYLTETGTYGLPIAIDPLMMFYNRPALLNAGIPNPPSTWEAVNSLAQTMTEASPSGVVMRSVISLGEYANVANARAILSTIFFQAGVPISYDAQGSWRGGLLGTAGDASGSVSALDFYTQFADPSNTVYTWNRALPNSRDAFLAGDLIFYPGFASERTRLAVANPNLDFDMAALPQPSVAALKMTYGLLYAAAIPRAAYNAAGATEVAFALSDPIESTYIASLASMASAFKNELRPSAEDRFGAIFFPEALRARGWLSPAPSATDGIFAGMIGNVTSGRMSILESLKGANEALDAALP